MVEYKLLIIPIFESLSIFRKFGYKKVIQNQNTQFGIKIKNIDDKPFNEATIENVKIYPTQTPDFGLNCRKKFNVSKLNPNETEEIWFEKVILPFSGRVMIKLDIKNEGTIITHQWDSANNYPSEFDSNKNGWYKTFLIEDETFLQQKITNVFLIILTFLSVITGILTVIKMFS